MASQFELSRPTIRSYLTLIERLFLIEFLPPWFGNHVKRLIKSPKLHFGDTGLACSLLRCSAADLNEQRNLLGQLLETFVFGEIEKQASAHPERISLHHLRDKDGYEVDLVVQRGTRHAGIEVKAASSVRESDFRGLKRMRELLGPRFHGGIILYDGENALPFGDGLLAVPLSSLWARGPRASNSRRTSICFRVLLISSTKSRSSGRVVRYSAASTLFGMPSSAYFATAPSFSAQRTRSASAS
jgi:predicted AAA+ superfamily ATPase